MSTGAFSAQHVEAIRAFADFFEAHYPELNAPDAAADLSQIFSIVRRTADANTWDAAAEYGQSQASDLVRSGGRFSTWLQTFSRVRGVLRNETHRGSLLVREGMAVFFDRMIATVADAYAEEQTRRKIDARNAAILEAALDCIVSIDQHGRIIEFNPAAERTFGWSRQQAIGKQIDELLIPPRYRGSHREGLARVVAGGEGKILGRRVELFAQRSDGTEFPAEVAVVRIRSDGPPLFTGYIRDITERRRSEQALRESEAQVRRLIDSNLIGIIIWDRATGTIDANEALLNMIGYAREDLQSGKLNLATFSMPEFEAADAAARLEIAQTGRSTPRERLLPHRDGRKIPVLIGGAALAPGGERGISFVVDLSVQKKREEELLATQEQLRHAQKMEAVGRLAGGIAHDFNNLLSVILSYSHLLIEDLDPANPMREDLEEIRIAGRRAADLTSQLLAFSRQQISNPRVFDVDEALSGVQRMIERLVGENILVKIIPGADRARVKADPGHIEQVLLNLVVNARDAMPSGGRLTIETAVVSLDESYGRSHLEIAPGSYVMIAVSDTGAGMDKETQSRIFEPFFTTKETGKGTGLGLSTVFGIVKQAGGSIWVYSEPGKGSTFKIYLPATTEEADRARASQPLAELGGSETILVVEDDAQLLDVVLGILKKHGYRALVAANPLDALTLAREYSDEINLVLTDVVMPVMNGSELVHELKEVCRHAKVLYMSGYTEDAVVYHQLLNRGVELIQKPITPDALLRKVREVLS